MTAPNPRTDGIRRHRAAVSADKHRAVRTAVDRCVARGRVIPAATLARDAGVTETFLYRHEAQPCPLCENTFGGGPINYFRSRMQSIAEARDSGVTREGLVTTASLRADLANQRAANQRLRQQIRALEHRLGEVLGTQSRTDMTELARLVYGSESGDAQRILELSEQNRSLAGQLADRNEELDAVRRLNTELTRRINSTEQNAHLGRRPAHIPSTRETGCGDDLSS